MNAIVRSAVDLGLSLTSPENVDRAYRRTARELHPDKPGGCTSEFQDLLEAKETLKKQLHQKTPSTDAPFAAPAPPKRKRRRTLSPPSRARPAPDATDWRRERDKVAGWTPPEPSRDLASLPLRDLLRMALEEQAGPVKTRVAVRWIPPVHTVRTDFKDWRPGSWV